MNLKKAAITTQCAWRGRVARKELRKLKMAARETGALQAAKNKLEKQVEELTWRLQLEKHMRPKPLPVPDSEPKKKRGGRCLRKMKERYAITDMRKLANRMQFGIPEESSLGDGLGEGYGMLGQAGSGKLRVSVGQSKLAAKVAKKFKDAYSTGAVVLLQD